MEDATRRFTAIDNRNETREILSSVYDSLKVKGYNPINQLVGYIISEDPTYITNYNNARSLICRLDRDELLQELLVSYLAKKTPDRRLFFEGPFFFPRKTPPARIRCGALFFYSCAACSCTAAAVSELQASSSLPSVSTATI